MKRYLCWGAVLGVIAVPAWAIACRPFWGGPVVYAEPVYAVPAYPTYPVCQPPVYVAPPVCCQPCPGYTVSPPRIESATPTPAPPPSNTLAAPRPPVEHVRPAGGGDTGLSPTGGVRPPTVTTDPPPAPPGTARPVVHPEPKSVEPPKHAGPDTGLPPLVLPKEPGAAPADPLPKLPLVLPKEPASKGSVAPERGSTAVPSAAPAPDALLPPLDLPVSPDARKTGDLPPLILPPDTAPAPAGPAAKPDSVSRSSPLTGGVANPSVSVFPVGAGDPVDGVYRKIGFYNHTSREVRLTIEGRAVTLPAKSYLDARVASTFIWGHSDHPPARETVPAGAAGLDVVFRE